MSTADDERRPALPEPRHVSLRGDDCPQPEGEIKNSKENRLAVEKFSAKGEKWRVFRPLDKGSDHSLASTVFVENLEDLA